MSVLQARELAEELFGDSYTIEHRRFSDDDDRVIIKHHYGWSETNYVVIKIWTTEETVWVEYYEHDIRRTRDRYDLSEWIECIDTSKDLSDFAPNWDV